MLIAFQLAPDLPTITSKASIGESGESFEVGLGLASPGWTRESKESRVWINSSSTDENMNKDAISKIDPYFFPAYLEYLSIHFWSNWKNCGAQRFGNLNYKNVQKFVTAWYTSMEKMMLLNLDVIDIVCDIGSGHLPCWLYDWEYTHKWYYILLKHLLIAWRTQCHVLCTKVDQI